MKYFCFNAKVESYEHEGDIDIGLITSDVGRDSLIGREKGVISIGYDGCYGEIWHSWVEVASVEKVKEGNTLGCQIKNIIHGGSTFIICRFLKNGMFIGPPRCLEDADYFLSLALSDKPAKVYSDLGKSEFVLDAKGMFN